MVMRVALYARVSKKASAKKEKDLKENDIREQDTENQLTQLRRYCEGLGWIVTKEYVDRATGKNSDRDMFKELFQDAYQRKFDLVLFWSLDRFSREGVLETLQHLKKLSSYGVEWKSYTEQYLDSLGIFREAVLAILATIAKQERIRISERTIAGLERARAKGKVIGRPPVDIDINIVVQYYSEGMSLRAIAAALGCSKTHIDREIKRHEEANGKVRKVKEEMVESFVIETFQEDYSS